jgi:hypothetical protein
MGKKVIRMNESELVDLIHEILGDQVNEQRARFAGMQPAKPKLNYGTYNNVKVVYSDKGLVLTVGGKNFEMGCYKYPITQKPL